MTANTDYFDAALRHQVGIRRFTAGEVKRILALMEAADASLVRQLRERLIRLGSVEDFTGRRLRALLASVREERKKIISEVRSELRGSLLEFGAAEPLFEQRIIAAALPIEVAYASVPTPIIRDIVFRKPFQGKLLREWFRDLNRNDQRRLQETIQLGLVEGQTVQQMMRTIAGTRRNGFADGVLAVSRREAEAIVRTSVNHVSNRAREGFWNANSNVIGALRWTSTLDGRTSAICRSRDGKFAPIEGKALPPGRPALQPPGARPPAHLSCRSVMVAELDGESILGNRPFVRDTRTRRVRETDFRQIARARGVPIQQVRREWADRNIGQIPAKTTYQQWLRRQPAAFQDEVLGKAKGSLFRRGGLTLDRFMDRNGMELTLAELRETSPEAFIKAGI